MKPIVAIVRTDSLIIIVDVHFSRKSVVILLRSDSHTFEAAMEIGTAWREVIGFLGAVTRGDAWRVYGVRRGHCCCRFA